MLSSMFKPRSRLVPSVRLHDGTTFDVRKGETVLEIHAAMIIARRPMTARVWRISLSLADRVCVVPGQQIDIAVARDGSQPLARAFSVVDVLPTAAGTLLDIDVARRANGLVSNWLTREDAVGSTLQIAGPFGTCFAEDRPGPLITVGAGSGIGAAVGVLARSHALQPARQTMLLAYGSSTGDIYGLDELAQSARQAGVRHRSFAWVNERALAPPNVSRGRAPEGLTSALVKHGVISTPGDAAVPDCQVLLYGPGGFVDRCIVALTSSGLPASRIRFDRHQPPAGTLAPVE